MALFADNGPVEKVHILMAGKRRLPYHDDAGVIRLDDDGLQRCPMLLGPAPSGDVRLQSKMEAWESERQCSALRHVRDSHRLSSVQRGNELLIRGRAEVESRVEIVR